jgi:hypothetical protein
MVDAVKGEIMEYATLDDIDSIEADPHIRGTIPRAGGKLEFWLTRPRPTGVSIDEWEEIQQEKWDKIFSKKEK